MAGSLRSSVRPDPDVFQADTTVPPASGTSPTTAAIALRRLPSRPSRRSLLLVSMRGRSAVAGDDPLARAIRLLRESAGRPEADRRRAADLLARSAADRDHSPLAADAMRIAWAALPADPAHGRGARRERDTGDA